MKRTTEKLSMYISCRVVLNEEQRQILKQAYRFQMDELSPQPARIGGSTVTTQTLVRHPLERELPGILLTDLLSTRESLPLDTVIRLQRAFGVEVITPKDVLKQSESYVEYMFRDGKEA